ncbi:MAG TPA: VOC family protein [Acidimicrobiales bacterium]|nr:VOC family protein [Acidimicrobiales bacterium]
MARVGFPPGVPCWVDVTVPDPPAAAAFYGQVFGWELEDRVPADVPGHYFIARLDGRDVAAVGSQIHGPPAWNTFIGVESADDAAARVSEAGGRVLVEPFDTGPAGRMAVCADPAGAVFDLWQPGTRKGADVVNAPGSWNWSNLATPDLDAAARFYGAVFGWEATEAGIWRLPGYADFLEQFDPGLRQRHADFGAPEGFSDAVGWVFAGEEPRWTVTFSVDDTDGVVARAAALGATVVAEPVDVGPVRMANLRDPQGAELTVSRFAG